MIDAFKRGGCFHSRTAMGMFEHVADAVKRTWCLAPVMQGNYATLCLFSRSFQWNAPLRLFSGSFRQHIVFMDVVY